MTSKKYRFTHPVKLSGWRLVQIFYGSAYLDLDLKNDFFRLGINEAPVMFVFTNGSQYAYLTVSRNEMEEIPESYLGFDLALVFQDGPDLEKSSLYASSIELKENGAASGEVDQVLGIEREINGGLQLAAMSFDFRSGKNLYQYDNDLPDGLTLEYNAKHWLTHFASRYDL